MKALKAFRKPFEAPQRGCEKKVNFYLKKLSEMRGAGRLKKGNSKTYIGLNEHIQ